ncbi:hypothetical protein N9Y26_00290 [bacterium]|nr:hypothetical protein [bacterium]
MKECFSFGLVTCTGGIRCEKTSAYLKHHGFKDVNHVDEIVEVLLHGEGSRQVAQLSNLKKNYNDTLKLIPLDVEKAKRLLGEAGWVDTDGDNIMFVGPLRF